MDDTQINATKDAVQALNQVVRDTNVPLAVRQVARKALSMAMATLEAQGVSVR